MADYLSQAVFVVRVMLCLVSCLLLCACATTVPPVPERLAADPEAAKHISSMSHTLEAIVAGWGNAGRKNAIMARAQEFGLEGGMRAEWIDWFSLQDNLIIDLPGTSPQLVYVVAHYDKTDMNPVRFVSAFFNGFLDDLIPIMSDGAVDNGTGVSVALELARAVAARQHFLSYRFLFPGSEETGLRGTRAHLAGLSPEETQRIRQAINIDTVGVDFAKNCVSEDNPWSHKALEVSRRLNVPLSLSPDTSSNDSDYAPFRNNGFQQDFLLGLQNNYLGGLFPQRSWFGTSFTASVVNFSACGMSGSQGQGNFVYPVHGPSDNLSRVDLGRLYEQFQIVNELLIHEDALAAQKGAPARRDGDQ